MFTFVKQFAFANKIKQHVNYANLKPEIWHTTILLHITRTINRTLYVRHKLTCKFRLCVLLYFFGYKTELFSFQNNFKNLDPSYKMDLDIRDCKGRLKFVLQQNCIGLIWLFVLILERENPVL